MRDTITCLIVIFAGILIYETAREKKALDFTKGGLEYGGVFFIAIGVLGFVCSVGIALIERKNKFIS